MLRSQRIEVAPAVGVSRRLRAVVASLLATFVFTIPFDDLVSIPGLGTITRLVGLVTMPLALLALIDGDRVRFRAPTLFLLVSATFILWNVASYFWSVHPERTLTSAFTAVQLFIFVWLVSEFCRSAEALARLMQAFVLGNYVAVAVAVYLFLEGTGVARDTGRDPNEFATVLAWGIPVALWLVARVRGGPFRILNIAYPVFAVLGLVLAASRGGLLTALVGLFAVPFLIADMGVVRRLIFVVLVTGGVVLTFYGAPRLFPQLQTNLERLEDVGVELTEGTMTGRTVIWQEGVRIFQSSPLVGVGLSAARPLYVERFGGERTAHNTFLQVATETGAIGVLLFS
jgi:O-antigen ligase